MTESYWNGKVVAHRDTEGAVREGDTIRAPWYVGRVEGVEDKTVRLASGEIVDRDSSNLYSDPPAWLMKAFVESPYDEFLYVERAVGRGTVPKGGERIGVDSVEPNTVPTLRQ